MRVNPFRAAGMNPYKQQMNKAEKQPAANKTDRVEISAEAKKMQQIPSVEKERAAKIAKLKAQVQSGNYEIDPKSIAKSVLDFYRP